MPQNTHLETISAETERLPEPVHAAHPIAPVLPTISHALKMLVFRSHNFLAQLLSETSTACTIRVRRSTLGRLWNDLGSHACVDHRNRRPGTRGAQSPGQAEPAPLPLAESRGERGERNCALQGTTGWSAEVLRAGSGMRLRSGKLPFLGSEDEFFYHTGSPGDACYAGRVDRSCLESA